MHLEPEQHVRQHGAAMDQPLPRRRWRRIAIAVAIFAVLALAAVTLCWLMPRGLRVASADVRIAVAARGLYRDDMLVRAIAAPLHTVMLDAVESGRVEEVLARDGALVQRGDILFRLSNPQRRLELLQRDSERAQQISNALNLRIAQEAAMSERRRRLAELQFAAQEADKQHRRNVALAQQGFLSAAALEDSADRAAQQHRLADAEQAGGQSEERIRRDAQAQMEQALAGMERGFRLVTETVAALAVRAPVAGRLTDFRLQEGETVKPDQHLGRIDDPLRVKLTAQVDEYYLNRVALGQRGVATVDGRRHPVTVSRIFAQISEGRFGIELTFDSAAPALQPGQSAEVAIVLGAPVDALLLPHDAWVGDTSGMTVFVLSADGRGAVRRAIRTGRRNHAQVEVLDGLAPGERVIVSSYAAWGKAARIEFSQ